MKDSFYFVTCGTESELSCVANDLLEKCAKEGVELVYFRTLKTGHIPTFREVKLNCEEWCALKIIRESKISIVDKSHLPKQTT